MIPRIYFSPPYRIVLQFDAHDRLAYDRRPHLYNRLDQRLTRPWYFRLSTFERSCNSDLPRVPIASTWMIGFICLRAYVMRIYEIDRMKAMPLKFYSFSSGRERVEAGISRTIIVRRNVTMEVIGRRLAAGSQNKSVSQQRTINTLGRLSRIMMGHKLSRCSIWSFLYIQRLPRTNVTKQNVHSHKTVVYMNEAFSRIWCS